MSARMFLMIVLLCDLQTMLNLLEAFAVSLKHYLRGESDIHYEDLYHLVLFLPKVSQESRLVLLMLKHATLTQHSTNSQILLQFADMISKDRMQINHMVILQAPLRQD